MSEANLAAPVTFAGPSIRGAGLPRYLVSLGQGIVEVDEGGGVRGGGARDLERGGEHVRVGTAAAEVAGAGLAHLGLGGMGILPHERGEAHHETRRAVAALQAVAGDERLLHGREARAGDALDGGDFAARRLDREQHAGVDRHAVEQHGAGAAGRAFADLLRAGQAGVEAQGLEERGARLERERAAFAVDGKRDRHRARAVHALGVELREFLRHALRAQRGGGDGGRAETAKEVAP
jgi:hypothetical protein